MKRLVRCTDLSRAEDGTLSPLLLIWLNLICLTGLLIFKPVMCLPGTYPDCITHPAAYLHNHSPAAVEATETHQCLSDRTGHESMKPNTSAHADMSLICSDTVTILIPRESRGLTTNTKLPSMILHITSSLVLL